MDVVDVARLQRHDTMRASDINETGRNLVLPRITFALAKLDAYRWRLSLVVVDEPGQSVVRSTPRVAVKSIRTSTESFVTR